MYLLDHFKRFLSCRADAKKDRTKAKKLTAIELPPTTMEQKIKRLPKAMMLSAKGIDLIKEFEGFRAEPYKDIAGIWTIGYGQTGKHVHKDSAPITEEEAHRLLRAHVDLVERDVRSLVRAPLNQNQYDALVSFAYNVGTDIDADEIAEGLGDSTLLKKLNRGDYQGAADEFKRWVFAGGKRRRGLITRRAKERELFLS